MKLRELIVVLSVSFCAARGSELDLGREADRVNASGRCNLTQILNNWRSSIMAQVKDLLLHHHETVLPDYSRIPPMSESLHTLNKEFNRTRQDVDQLGATLRSFKDLLRKLILVQNVSRTSGGVIRRIRKKKLLVKTGQVNRHLPRKKGRIPRLRTRLPAARPQRNSSPRILINKPAWR